MKADGKTTLARRQFFRVLGAGVGGVVLAGAPVVAVVAALVPPLSSLQEAARAPTASAAAARKLRRPSGVGSASAGLIGG